MTFNETSAIALKESFAPKKFLDFAMNQAVWILLVLAIVVMGIFRPSFYSFGILSNILVQATVLGLLAIAISMVIILGDINLSTVGTAGFSALSGVLAMKSGLPVILSILLILVVGSLIGLVNGLIVTKLKANALITTLAMNMVLMGALLAITGGTSISQLPDSYKFVSQSNIGGFPILPIVMFAVFALFYVIWQRTRFGRALFAVGGNPRGAYIAGINVDRVKIGAYVVSGLLCGLAGWLLSGYMGAVTSSFGSSYEMQVIAAAVIGGVSLTGGKGSMQGVLAGTLLLTVIQVGLAILGIPQTLITLAGGLMIFAAVLIDALRNLYNSRV
ncbi:ABC transporter permease [Mycetocola reblochoni]|uniref:Xylose transport system permease protein XylH n=2 Tax=Mycetocola reblochoni TaxID=331618 RepID=A0A1R4KBL9_9MICO|nr:ABC transporter permease [Mycetocola reblochoni]RLP67926.1 ABC transporter permease [Mycetocola reblochoni]SJN41687.1 Ribose ABC transport system, permease protein RbsC (TC 3.A.1.2.1) [Mycetocola reblochoni REB411]